MKRIKIKLKRVNKKRVFKILLLSFLFLFLSISASQAAYLTFTPQVGIPNTEFATSVPFNDKSGTEYIARFVSAIYSYGVSVGAILAAIMLMAGGLIWLTSGGSQEKVGKAKDIISGSIIGLFLLMGAYTILNMVNPNLVDLRVRPIEGIEKVEPGCCQFYTYPTSMSYPPKMDIDIRMTVTPGVNPVISSLFMNSEESCVNLENVYISNTSIKQGGSWKGYGYAPDPNKINGACVKMGCCEITFKKPTAIFANEHTIKFPLGRNSCLGGQTVYNIEEGVEDGWAQTVSWTSNYCPYEGNVDSCSHKPDGSQCFFWGDGSWQKSVLNFLGINIESLCLHDYKCGFCYKGSCLPKLGRPGEICGDSPSNLGFCYDTTCNNISGAIINHDRIQSARRCLGGQCCQ